jgi:alkylglycerol monooxygenase
MDPSAIHLAIPVFFLLIGVELVVARLLERDVYRLSDSVNDLSCGVLQQVVEVFLKTALFAGYASLFASHRLFEIPATSAWAWTACFVGVDFLYYWFHRWSHEVGAGWAAHVVHHQSEEYNLTVALRQGAFQPAFSWVFYLPLALVGFPPVMFLAVSSFNTLYQFWIHTRLIGRLGPLEWVLNTPSHHRVHHARNPKYIDRNHGGTLIVWDRLFGTFGQERDEPIYGITKPLASWNPVWANLHQWSEMWDVAKRAGRPLDKARVLWKRPGWRPDELGGPLAPREVDQAALVKYDVPVARGVTLYVLAQFVAVNVGTVAFLYESGRLALPARAAGGAAVVWSLASLGGLLDRRDWAAGFEIARLLAVSLAFLLLPLPGSVAAGGLALAGASAAWILRARKEGRERGLPLAARLR